MNLRILLFEECFQSCAGCCNKDFDLNALPNVTPDQLVRAGQIMLTGGEPLMHPLRVHHAIRKIKLANRYAPIILYTAFPGFVASGQRAEHIVFGHAREALEKLDGMTVTLHSPEDTPVFQRFDAIARDIKGVHEKSLRLNVFDNVPAPLYTFGGWQMKTGIRWIKNCPLPEDEVFVRWPA
jgi:hypothetical protein